MRAAFGGIGGDLTRSVLKRSSLYVLACMGAALAIASSAPSAEFHAPTMGGALTDCAQRVDELEREVQLLRDQLARQRASSAAPGRGMARLEKTSVVSTHSLPECAVPFQISKAGIKRFKYQCLQALQTLSPCDIPFEVDERGVKSFKPHCL